MKYTEAQKQAMREDYEERAAIKEHEAGMSREAAEKQAREEVMQKVVR